MKVIERTRHGLRVARVVMRPGLADPPAPRFTLYPMFHVADPGYYARVKAETDGHDTVLAEGVGHPFAAAAVRMHRLMASRWNGLAAQADALPFGLNWRRADIAPERFDASFRRAPWAVRNLLPMCFVLGGVALMGPWTRRLLIGREDGDDTPASDALTAVFGRDLAETVTTDRDRALATACDARIATGRATRIAVVWGAGHMPPLVAHLESVGYSVADVTWLTAIDAQRPTLSRRLA